MRLEVDFHTENIQNLCQEASLIVECLPLQIREIFSILVKVGKRIYDDESERT